MERARFPSETVLPLQRSDRDAALAARAALAALTDFLSVGQRARERPSAAKRAIARESLAKVRIVMEIARIASETVLPLRGLTGESRGGPTAQCPGES